MRGANDWQTGLTAPALGETEPSEAPNRIETVGNRYEVLSYLGHGGMGVVYEARDRLTQSVVALKRLTSKIDDFQHPIGKELSAMLDRAASAGPAGAVEASASFRIDEGRSRLALASEFRLLASLRHPNIIGVLDYGFAVDRRPFFTMELVKNHQTLTQAAVDLSPRRQLDLLLQGLEALCFLHRRGVVHRDLKPSNILVENERVRVLDFGLATPRGSDASQAGTLSHMAPEVLRGELPEPAADLYALGVMAFQIFAGVHPWHGVAPEAFAKAVLTTEPDWSRVDATPAIRAAIERLLQKNPADRFASAEQALDALTQAGNLVRPRERHDTRESCLRSAELAGRQAERKAFAGALRRLLSGKGGMWLVEGESGIGKTRLLDEMRVLALVLGTKVIRGQARSGPSAAFALWREPLRNLLLGEPVADALAGLLAHLVPDISALLERPMEPAPVTPQTARTRLLGAISQLITQQTAPVLLLLEDLHWAGDSLDVLRTLALSLRDRPVLVIGTYRGEEAPGLSQTIPGAHHLRLGPLAPKDVASLARSMLGPDASSDPRLLALLESHTQGNAFFVIEVLRTLAEEAGSLAQVVSRPIPEELISQGVDAVIDRRLRRIDASLEPFFAWCAVVGRALDRQLVEDEFGAPVVQQALAVGAELSVLEVADSGWRFAHDKFREALLSRTSQAQTTALHAEVAAAIERVHSADPAWAAPLAEHCRLAGLGDKELRFSTLAGQAALERGAYAEASRLLDRSLELLTRQGAPNPEQHLKLLLLKGPLMAVTLSFQSSDGAQAVYEQAIEIARASGQHPLVIPPLYGLALTALARGAFNEGDALGKNLVRLATESGDTVGHIQGLVIRTLCCAWLGHSDQATALHEELLQLYAPEQLPLHLSRFGWHPQVMAAVTHSTTIGLCGDPDGAVTIYREALRMAELTGSPSNLTLAYQTAVRVHYLRREPQETAAHVAALSTLAQEASTAPEAIRQVIEQHRRSGQQQEAGAAFRVAKPHTVSTPPAKQRDPMPQTAFFEISGEIFGGWADALGGHPQSGLARVRRAWARWRSQDQLWCTTGFVLPHAEVSLLCGEIGEAEALLAEALGTGFGSERCYHSELHRLQGDAWLARGDAQGAREEYCRAAELARRQGAKLFEMRALGALGSVGGADESAQGRLTELRRSLGDIAGC